MSPLATVRLRHNKIDLALHQLRADEGRPLLHLHGLGERSPDTVPEHLAAWPGPVWALDLSGHGASDVAVGGGYFCEALMGDVDTALAHLGPVTIFGRGLGAYVGLLAAGGAAGSRAGCDPASTVQVWRGAARCPVRPTWLPPWASRRRAARPTPGRCSS